jgi:hypothetical protein
MHMKKLSCLLLMVALASSPAWADCTYPKLSGKIPNGRSATKAQMVEAQNNVKKYQSEITAYLGCLKTDHDAALIKDAATLTDKQRETMTAKYVKANDDAVDAAKEVADRWNEQRAVFVAKDTK